LSEKEYCTKIKQQLKNKALCYADMCYELYMIISDYFKKTEDNDGCGALLGFFLEQYNFIDLDNITDGSAHYSPETFQAYVSIYSQQVEDKIGEITCDNPDKDLVYKKLWDFVCGSQTAIDSTQKSILIALIGLDIRMPYIQLEPGIDLSDEQFQEISEEMEKLVPIIISIFIRSNLRTEETSRLIKLADSLEDEIHRSVFWAMVLAIKTNALKDRIEELENVSPTL